MPEPTWVQDAARLWATHLGLANFGRLGKALKPLVAQHGWDQVGVWLGTYLTLAPIMKRDGSLAGPEDVDQVMMANARWITPEQFVGTYHVWRKLSESVTQ